MKNKQLIALYTLVRREFVRMCRIATQVFLPPIITTTLYFMIFGTLMANHVTGLDNNISYSMFIAPGLIIMAVISNSYSNVSSSLFTARFQKSIEEILVSPMHRWLILLGYVFGGICRGTIVAFLVLLVSWIFIPMHINHIVYTFLIVLGVATLFSLAGFINGILARNFDDVMIISTFILTPLTYLGGVFYKISMLSEIWQIISRFNPIFYIVNLMRIAMFGQEEVSIILSLSIIGSLLLSLIILNLVFLHRGVGLQE